MGEKGVKLEKLTGIGIDRVRHRKFFIEKHHEYNSLAEELSVLLDERYPEHKIERVKESLYEAYVKRGRALDEIIDLIQDADEYIWTLLKEWFSRKKTGS